MQKLARKCETHHSLTMSKCPYTWFRSVFKKSDLSAHENNRGGDQETDKEASELRVRVSRQGNTTVDIALPARSARWLISVIPDDVVAKIRLEGIPIDSIQSDLASSARLLVQPLFSLEETDRQVQVWLE